MKKLTVLFMMGLLLFSSCNKKNDETSYQPNIIPDYTPMEIGYYWVYEHVMIDSLGNETLQPFSDSVYISKDTLIRGEKYFVFEGHWATFPYSKYLRDSNSYLVNEKGTILFSAVNFDDVLFVEDTFYQPFFTVQYQMDHIDSLVAVPFGVFEALNYKGTVYHNDTTYPWGNLFLHNLYGKDVGSIITTYWFYLSAFNIVERRLVRSNVQLDE